MLDFVSCDLFIVLNRREWIVESDEELFSTPDTSPASRKPIVWSSVAPS